MKNLIRKAFTLIELLVVIAIIGILSGLIVISIGGMTDKANLAKVQVFSNSLRNSLMIDLISEWKFDDISGTVDQALANSTVVPDSWGDNNGSTSGGPVLRGGTNCVTGYCLESTAVNQYVNCGSNFNIINKLTLEFWIKAGVPTGTTWRSIIYKKTYQDATPFAIRNCGGSSMYFTLKSSDGSNTINIATSNVFDSKWNHVVASYDGKNGRIYVNGVLKVTSSDQVFTIDPSVGTNFYIGSASNSEAFIGKIDDVRIYDAEIPTSLIKENYYTGLNSLLANGNINAKEYNQKINLIAVQ